MASEVAEEADATDAEMAPGGEMAADRGSRGNRCRDGNRPRQQSSRQRRQEMLQQLARQQLHHQSPS